MEIQLLEEVTKQIKLNKKVALATITRIEGSTPRKEGAMMVIREDGTIDGTIGGGALELAVKEEAIGCIKEGKSESFKYELTDEGSLHMQCGGSADVFIKVFTPCHKLLIVGGGHIGLELYKVGKMLGFFTVIFDDREEFVNANRFPEGDELIFGDIEKELNDYPIDENCYIVIVTRGHAHDEIALKSVIDRGANYVGVIGSKNKTKYVMKNLRNEGISQESIEEVYAPIGIDMGGKEPIEIAFSIMAEILIVKNKGSLVHMKEKMRG